MPRIVLISDTHGLHGEMLYPIPSGDILIHAGDLTSKGNLEELQALNAFFAKLPHKHKVCIAGNHDFCFEKDMAAAKTLLPDLVYLQDELVEIMGLKIYGSPWQPRFFDWAFNLERGEPLAKVWAKIPEGIDVLVTHGPPQGILDQNSKHQNPGCEELLPAVKRLKPKVHVFGHVHESYGKIQAYGTTFVNASICTKDYKAVNEPIVIDL